MSDDAPERGENEQFRIDGGVLHCPEDMNRVQPRELRSWCDRLLKSQDTELVVDLTQTSYMASHHLGLIAAAWSGALASGKDLAIRLSPQLKKLFRLSGFDQVFGIPEDGEE